MSSAEKSIEQFFEKNQEVIKNMCHKLVQYDQGNRDVIKKPEPKVWLTLSEAKDILETFSWVKLCLDINVGNDDPSTGTVAFDVLKQRIDQLEGKKCD